MNPFQVEPADVCTVNYSCENISRPPQVSLDLCSVINDAIFDAETGNYEFESSNMATYIPGTYEFKITGTVGSTSTYI